MLVVGVRMSFVRVLGPGQRCSIESQSESVRRGTEAMVNTKALGRRAGSPDMRRSCAGCLVCLEQWVSSMKLCTM